MGKSWDKRNREGNMEERVGKGAGKAKGREEKMEGKGSARTKGNGEE